MNRLLNTYNRLIESNAPSYMIYIKLKIEASNLRNMSLLLIFSINR